MLPSLYSKFSCIPVSTSEKLYDSDTILWCDINKPMKGLLTVDGKSYSFMGLGNEPVIEQKSVH